MIKYNTKTFSEIFNKLGVSKGDVILIHNSLLTFGLPMDCKITETPKQIYNQLKKIVGKEGTISVPTFNFDFCKGIIFDRQKTPSKNMGVFSEFVRNISETKRSTHPMQSISTIGKYSDYIIENDTKSAFSTDGSFDRLRKLDGKIMLLGADFNTSSIIHLIEEKYNVPYRYWKTFSGNYVDKGILQNKSYNMFVRSLETNAILKMYKVEEELIKQKKIEEIKVGGGYIKLFKIKDFINIAENYIKQNPYFFVSNHKDFEKI